MLTTVMIVWLIWSITLLIVAWYGRIDGPAHVVLGFFIFTVLAVSAHYCVTTFWEWVT